MTSTSTPCHGYVLDPVGIIRFSCFPALSALQRSHQLPITQQKCCTSVMCNCFERVPGLGGFLKTGVWCFLEQAGALDSSGARVALIKAIGGVFENSMAWFFLPCGLGTEVKQRSGSDFCTTACVCRNPNASQHSTTVLEGGVFCGHLFLPLCFALYFSLLGFALPFFCVGFVARHKEATSFIIRRVWHLVKQR